MSGKSSCVGNVNWVLDSRASHHMTFNGCVFESLHNLSKPISIVLPDGRIILAEKAGDVNLGAGWKLREVLHTPTFKENLISVRQLARDKNCIIIYGVDFCMIQDLTPKKLIGTAEAENGMYYLKPSARGTVFAATHTKEAILWHQRLGHPSFISLSSLLVSCGFHLNKEQLGCCDVCHRVKQTRNPFTISTNKAERPFSLIHCDLWGRYHTPSIGGCHYFLCIVDHFSRAIWVFLLKDKTETYNRLVDFCSMVKTQFGCHIQRMRSDNGKEFINKPLQAYF